MTANSRRALQVIEQLQQHYPDAHCSLDFKTDFQLLVATVLSAQCTDARVNLVTPSLFKKFPDIQAMAKADVTELEELVRSTGFYRNKAKNILAASKILMKDYAAKIPRDILKLSQLPGVGRKTANVVLGNAYGIPGMVVDTHVTRLSFRLGFSRGKTPEAIEKELSKIIPKEHWIQFSHWLIAHGRTLCTAKKVYCEKCFLKPLCPQKGVKKVTP